MLDYESLVKEAEATNWKPKVESEAEARNWKVRFGGKAVKPKVEVKILDEFVIEAGKHWRFEEEDTGRWRTKVRFGDEVWGRRGSYYKEDIRRTVKIEEEHGREVFKNVRVEVYH